VKRQKKCVRRKIRRAAKKSVREGVCVTVSDWLEVGKDARDEILRARASTERLFSSLPFLFSAETALHFHPLPVRRPISP